MPKETDRLKLPLPLGNENVTRESINRIFEKIDAGVATQEDLDALREAVSQMDIPDASLTQKGKVQLSSKTDGMSETVAATEKAIRDARVVAETNAKNASLPRTGGVLTGVLTAPQIEMPNGTTIRTDGTRTSINAAANRFDVISTDGQKYLFSSRSGDFYMYDEVGDLITTAKELKQSGVDARNGVVGAINAAGGNASTSDTWPSLQSKLKVIARPRPGNTLIYGPRDSGWAISSTQRMEYSSLTFTVNESGTYRISFSMQSPNSSIKMYGAIQRNGSDYMVNNTDNTGSLVTFTQDLYFDAGDVVSFYGWLSSPANYGYFNKMSVGILTLGSITPKYA